MDYPVHDQWGRPGIKLPGDSSVTYHTRASTVAKALDDMNGLMRWRERMVAGGSALRPDILAKVKANWPVTDKNKAKLDKCCEELKEAAAASAGANMGDALHTAFERCAGGAEVRPIEPLDKDIDALIACLAAHDLRIVRDLVEKTVVLSQLPEPVAGTFDAIVAKGDEMFIMDLKTGQNLDYSWGSFAVQLAIYAHGEHLYDFDLEQFSDMPPVNQKSGLILHCAAGTAKASLHVVDIAEGWRAVKAAMWVRQWQKRKDIARPARKIKERANA
jgi:hypothetical protein